MVSSETAPPLAVAERKLKLENAPPSSNAFSSG